MSENELKQLGQNWYKILGVKKDAAEDEVRKAYRDLSRKYHTDWHPNATEDEQKK